MKLHAIALAFLVACSSCRPYVPPVVRPIVDCVNANRPAIDALIVEMWPVDGGLPNWGRVKDLALNAGVEIGGCALAELIQSFMAPAPGTAAPPPDQMREARGTLEWYRKEVAGGASFKTEHGAL